MLFPHWLFSGSINQWRLLILAIMTQNCLTPSKNECAIELIPFVDIVIPLSSRAAPSNAVVCTFLATNMKNINSMKLHSKLLIWSNYIEYGHHFVYCVWLLFGQIVTLWINFILINFDLIAPKNWFGTNLDKAKALKMCCVYSQIVRLFVIKIVGLIYFEYS